jgi:hypothetical protein
MQGGKYLVGSMEEILHCSESACEVEGVDKREDVLTRL